MIWPEDVSLEGFSRKVSEWFSDSNHFIGDPPIDAQYALDLIFKTLVDDKVHYPYLTAMPESTEQVNSIKLDLILKKYSKEYRSIYIEKEYERGKLWTKIKDKVTKDLRKKGETMKIIKQGDLEKARQKNLCPKRFIWPDCGCIFVANNTEYTWGDQRDPGPFATCPCCKRNYVDANGCSQDDVIKIIKGIK